VVADADESRATAATSNSELAEALRLLTTSRNTIYTFTGADLTGRQRDEFLTQVVAHLENGRAVTTELLILAVGRAETEFRRHGEGKQRGIGWVLNALRDLLQEAHAPPAPVAPRERPDAVALQSWRSFQCKHSYAGEWERVAFYEDEHRAALRRYGWPEGEIEREIEADRRHVRETAQEQGLLHRLATRATPAGGAAAPN